MQQEKSNWIRGIEQNIVNSRNNRILWFLILLFSILLLYFSGNISLILGLSKNPIGLISILLAFIAILGVLTSTQHPDYLAYYLYQIGNELPDFEIEENYLKRNLNYIKNCDKQISYLIGVGERDLRGRYFTNDILNFLDKLNEILLHLNYVYSSKDANERFMERQDFLSVKLKELANYIHKNHSCLTSSHIELANELFNELIYLPAKPLEFHRIFIGYLKEKWSGQPYVLKMLEFLVIIFIILFTFLSQIMIKYFELGKESYGFAITGSIMIIAALLNKIELFIARERVKKILL